MYLLDKGKAAYRELANAIPGNPVYDYMCAHINNIVDLLQKLVEDCGDRYSIDLIQACELREETGSRYSWSVIRNYTGAFPATTASDLHH